MENNPIKADVLFMRAAIHYAYEEFDEALKLDFQALSILQRHYPEEHADIGTAYNTIAREYFSLKHFNVALEYYLKANKIYEYVYSKNHSDTAEVYGSISRTYMKLGDYNNALEWCLLALDAQKKTLGNEHPEVILRHSFLSEIYERLRLHKEAIGHLQSILNYYDKVGEANIIDIINERIADNKALLNKAAEAGLT